MGAGTLAADMAQLVSAGKAPTTPVACIQWGTRHDQRVVAGTVADIAARAADAGLGSPLVTVVGEVARLAAEIAWFSAGPLAGRRIAITRAERQAGDFASRLEALGAHVVRAPAIVTRFTGDDLVIDERAASRWDWILFTSANGVAAFFARLESAGRDVRAIGGTKVGAVGEATSWALRAHGVIADFVPSRATGLDLAAEVPRVQGARVLLPGSSLSDGHVAEALRGRGALVEEVVVYETLPGALSAAQAREVADADAVAFTSGSTARYLRQALGEATLGDSVKLVSIGPETSSAVRESFGRVDREAGAPSLDALVEALREELAWA
jgi:uroporphyrinogen III methyltransferase/synthase